jgi:hypothetical protein
MDRRAGELFVRPAGIRGFVMRAAIQLKYHQATLDFVGRKPAFSRPSVARIDAAEKKVGLRLPAAVREWYSLTRCDTIISPPYWIELMPLRNLPKSLQAVRDSTVIGPTGDKLNDLQVGYVDGTNYRFWLSIGESDDPPVIETDRDIIMAAQRFSEFIFGLAWERNPDLPDDALAAEKHRFGPPPLDFMKEHYKEGLVHYSRSEGHGTYDWTEDIPGYTYRNYPFYNSDGMVTIRCSGDPTAREVPALWSFCAESVEALVSLVAPVWRFGGLNKALRATSKMGESALKKLKKG